MVLMGMASMFFRAFLQLEYNKRDVQLLVHYEWFLSGHVQSLMITAQSPCTSCIHDVVQGNPKGSEYKYQNLFLSPF